MMQLSNDQLNNLPKEALIIITSSLQEQLALMQDQLDKTNSQLDKANDQLADQARQLEIFAEQLRIMNQRHFGKHSEAASEIDGQLSFFDAY